MMKETSFSAPKKVYRQSEVSSISGQRPLPIGINVELLRVLKNDRFELRNKLAGLTSCEFDKEKTSNGSIILHGPRPTLSARKSTRPDMQMQLRKTRLVKPVQLFQNTYRLEPDKRFDKWLVGMIIENTLKHNLKQFLYEPRAAALMVKGLSEEIKFRVKLENYDRCRIICLVTIIQRLHQQFCEMAKSLLDLDFDQFATYVYDDNPTFYAIGTVFGIYYE